MRRFFSAASSDDHLATSNWYYVGCFFVTIASVLGTGILGLPVKTANSGFYPFLLIFVIVLIMEEVIVIYFVELLQYTAALNDLGIHSLQGLREAVADKDGKTIGNLNIKSDAYQSLPDEDNEDNEMPPDKTKARKINLHSMGKLFLTPRGRWVFDFVVFAHFMAIMISYVLAGSESWGQIFGIEGGCKADPSTEDQVNLRLVILSFGLVFTSCIIFGQRLFTSVVSLMTAVKGTLLVLMVVITAYVAIDIHLDINNDWTHLAETFLMSTVALGGAINLMPLIYNKVPQTRLEVNKFRYAVMVGLMVCGLLVVLWTYFVMLAVPQEGPKGTPSLAEAEDNGCISTIPLTDIIKEDHPDLTWVATIVEVFILISVTVSYITVGSGLKNFLDGYARHFSKLLVASRYNFLERLPPKMQWMSPNLFFKILLYLGSFGLCVGFALGKPACFLVVLEYFGSFALNVESGVFVAFMIMVSSKYGKMLGVEIPEPLPQPWSFYFSYVTGLFFFGAVIYDVVDITMKSVDKGSLC
jgi:amino acid permease